MSWPACESDEGDALALAGLPAGFSQHAHVSFIFSQHSIIGFSAGAAWACATPGRAIANATAALCLFISVNSVKSKDRRFHALRGGGVGSSARKGLCLVATIPASTGR